MCAEAMQEGLALLKPLLVENASGGKGTVVIGAVKGDLHDIGKNLVVLMLEGAGFTVVDLGTKSIVGGAPLTQGYADEIKADGYASDAPGAVALCKSMLA